MRGEQKRKEGDKGREGEREGEEEKKEKGRGRKGRGGEEGERRKESSLECFAPVILLRQPWWWEGKLHTLPHVSMSSHQCQMPQPAEGHTEERRGRGGCYTCRKDELMVDIEINERRGRRKGERREGEREGEEGKERRGGEEGELILYQ